MEAKAGANRDYAIAEMDENYQKNRYCDWCGLVDWCARVSAETCAELNTGTVLQPAVQLQPRHPAQVRALSIAPAPC